MKNQELIKTYKAAVETVGTKRRWSQGGNGTPSDSGISAMARLLEDGDIILTKRDVSRDALDVSPSGSMTRSEASARTRSSSPASVMQSGRSGLGG